ncbi:para-aminobenzoate synthetase component 1 [Pustulibacterium marinum]|uniref:Para-aminobenzoate synthetase component 1 n=1 Tax=Pustulibacterium marinum TaxID=1224947 RepID=A0A1I7FP75_9FLAO|nr:anthranilate synthase component I family protein [Pustulibacterium marinum]SFU37971.1 para-aminobenzoate synthetase component 1 [Pustulibacterium marinum]
MKRTTQTLSIKEYQVSSIKEKLVQWAQQYEEVCWLDSNDYKSNHNKYEAVLAVDAITVIKSDTHEAFEKLKEYQGITQDWLFGFLGYDLKNDTEPLSSKNLDALGFADLYFFQPKKVIFLENQQLTFQYLGMVDDEIEFDYKAILEEAVLEVVPEAKPKIKARISKEAYIEKIESMQAYIHRGDIYEANFCMEFFAESVSIDPAYVFRKLNEISSPPFATFLKLQTHYLMSASPERYLMRKGTDVLSQPIKGTVRRSLDEKEDHLLAETLEADLKERAENIMIVDLVRNDLSHFANRGSVVVEELCKVYSFKQVHQLISTVKATIPENTNSIDLIKSTFPMGSMTGAPKISAMKIIEELEESKRGLYSGAVGYFDPNNDFDFNVVIRSILYNAESKYASFSVGSAITSKSEAIKEYEECMLKAKAMKQVLSGAS